MATHIRNEEVRRERGLLNGSFRSRHRRRSAHAAASLLAAAVLAVTAGCQASSPPSPISALPPSQDSAAYLPAGPILTVNGDPVDSREFLLQMDTNEAQVFQYFHDHYGVQDSAGFWTVPHGGVTPLAMIKELTTQQLVRLTVQLEMARARGLVRNITYGGLTAGLQQENERLATAVAQHQPVYGLTSFTEATYFNYVTGNLETDLTQNVEEAVQPPPTTALEQLYGQLRSQDFACPSTGQEQSGEPQGTSQGCATGTKYLPFAAVESQVLQQWKENQVDALISANVRAAKAQINHTVFDKVIAP